MVEWLACLTRNLKAVSWSPDLITVLRSGEDNLLNLLESARLYRSWEYRHYLRWISFLSRAEGPGGYSTKFVTEWEGDERGGGGVGQDARYLTFSNSILPKMVPL